MLRKDERTSIFIDGANFFTQLRTINVTLDYFKFLKYIEENTNLIRAYYYTAIDYGSEHVGLKPLLDFLEYNGFSMVTKPLKWFDDGHGTIRKKGNMDIEIAIDTIQQSEHLDNIILATGDGDFTPLVEYLKDSGTRVTVISSLDAVMTADDLRRACDCFIDLSEIAPSLARTSVDIKDDVS